MASSPPPNAWDDGMKPRSTKDMNVKEVREMDPSKTSIYTQGKLVRDGMAPPGAELGPSALPEGNGLNDLLKWSIANANEADLTSLRERVARGEYDPAQHREFLEAMMGEGDLTKMRNQLKVVLDDDADSDAKVCALEEIEFLTESIDNANDLLKVGGLMTIIDCLGKPGVAIPKAAAAVIATCTQNNPKCQQAALDAHLVHTLLAGMIGEDERQKALTASFVYALSASVRGHAPSAQALVDAGGIALLARVAIHSDARARRRALFLLAMLVVETPGVARALRECAESAQAILDALEHADTELQSQALSTVFNTLQGEAVEGAERLACREWWIAHGVVSALQDLAQRLLLRLTRGEQSQDDDASVPLRIADILGKLTSGDSLGSPTPLPPVNTGPLPPVTEGGDDAEAAAVQPAAPVLALK